MKKTVNNIVLLSFGLNVKKEYGLLRTIVLFAF